MFRIFDVVTIKPTPTTPKEFHGRKASVVRINPLSQTYKVMVGRTMIFVKENDIEMESEVALCQG